MILHQLNFFHEEHMCLSLAKWALIDKKETARQTAKKRQIQGCEQHRLSAEKNISDLNIISSLIGHEKYAIRSKKYLVESNFIEAKFNCYLKLGFHT